MAQAVDILSPTQSTFKPIQVSFRFLLSLYGILGLCLLTYCVDQVLLGGWLRRTLPLAPESYFYLTLIFGTPHIVASSLIMVTNRAYFALYKWRLLWATLAIIAFFAVGYFVLSYTAMFVIIATITVVHVVKQQLGIGNGVARLSGPVVQVWMWSVIAACVIMYNGIFIGRRFSPDQLSLMHSVMLALCGVIVASALVLNGRCKAGLGRGFLWANTAIALLSLFLYKEGYFFLAILGPRVVHDVTAFVFYMVHDHNKHGDTPKNGYYKVLAKVGIGAFVAVPLSAILITYFLQNQADKLLTPLAEWALGMQLPGAIAFGFVGYLSLMHYFTESFTWKRTSPYKQYIPFKAP